MKNTLIRSLLIFSIATDAAVFTKSAIAADSPLRMLGLAMHQDTGRSIYLGALHLGVDIPNPDSLILAPAPKAMEYRVVARRTSVRSLLGTMLLQSEVANGMPPSPETDDFADALLSIIRGSLYAGDSFVIELNEQGNLTASLNGVTLVDRADSGVFDYLLNGWIGQNSPSTSFRSEITRTDIDSTLLSDYSAHLPTTERISLVSEWSQPLNASYDRDLLEALVEIEVVFRPLIPIAALAVPNISADINTSVIADITPISGTSADGELGNRTAKASIPPAGEQPVDELLAFNIEDFETTAADAIDTIIPVSAAHNLDGPMSFTAERLLSAQTIAAVRISERSEQEQDQTFDILSLDLTEYSNRLARFNSTLITLVYSQIKYPRRAIKRDIQGALELDITMLEDGSLIGVAIGESSGYSVLDVAAVEAAQKALASSSLGNIDAVAVTEYRIGGNLVIPVPVNFILK